MSSSDNNEQVQDTSSEAPDPERQDKDKGISLKPEMKPLEIAGGIIIIVLPLVWFITDPGFEPLIALITGILIVLSYVIIRNRKVNWLLAIVLVVASIVGVFFIIYKPKPPIRSAGCVPTDAKREEGRVVRVIDGDTIEVRLEDGLTYSVRYIGVDTPEKGDPFYYETTTKNVALVEGKTVTLVRDVSETDKYDRLLRYVFVGDTFVNYEIVRLGYATTATYPPDVACASTFASAEEDAQQYNMGLWAP